MTRQVAGAQVRWTMLALAHVQRLVRLTGFVKVVMRAASSPFRSSCKLLEKTVRESLSTREERTTSMLATGSSATLGRRQSRLDSALARGSGSTVAGVG